MIPQIPKVVKYLVYITSCLSCSQDMHYWGGAAPGTFKCACGLTEEGCAGNSETCNCDSLQDTSDDGLLMHKDYLPVLELHFGDTGSLTDDKVGYFELGHLECDGDSE